MSPQVIGQSDNWIAVSKPTGEVVIPGRNSQLVPLVSRVSKELNLKLFVVHRIDADTSGLVLFAKNAEAHRNLCVQFERREVEKVYLAAVLGEVVKGGVIDKALREFGSGRMGLDAAGKSAQTRYEVREKRPGATLLEVRPRTGRRHQIRVHLNSIGHPVLGDVLYGTDRPVGGAPRLMLHAWKLSFKDGGKPVSLICEPPPDFQQAWQAA